MSGEVWLLLDHVVDSIWLLSVPLLSLDFSSVQRLGA